MIVVCRVSDDGAGSQPSSDSEPAMAGHHHHHHSSSSYRHHTHSRAAQQSTTTASQAAGQVTAAVVVHRSDRSSAASAGGRAILTGAPRHFGRQFLDGSSTLRRFVYICFSVCCEGSLLQRLLRVLHDAATSNIFTYGMGTTLQDLLCA